MSTKENGKKWDGKSRVSNDIYRIRWKEIFGQENLDQELPKDEEDYLESLKEKL